MTRTYNIINALFIVVAALLLSGCGALVDGNKPFFISYTDATKSGVIIRGFVAQYEPLPEKHKKALANHAYYDLDGEIPWQKAGYEPFTSIIYLNTGRHFSFANRAAWRGYLEFSPALEIQNGDLIDGLTRYGEFPGLFGIGKLDGTNFVAVRIVCKFYDEECIARENRIYPCRNGAMVIDGKRRPDRTCGGYGSDSENWAAIIRPLTEPLTEYLDQHGAPYDECLISDHSCGKDEGLAITAGGYEQWLANRPNYLLAQQYATDFMDRRLYERDDIANERRYARYLSENMHSAQPVISKKAFLK